MARGSGRAWPRVGVTLALAVALAVPAVTAAAAREAYDDAADPGSLATIAAATGATAWWRAGYTGKGVDVAVVDTGVARVAGLAAAGKVVAGPDFSRDAGAARRDGYGHGTFVAGLIAARLPGAYRGIAPGARIVDVKVGAADGTTDAARVAAGIRWVVRHAHDGGLDVRVLNVAYGGAASQPPAVDPVAAAAELASRHGILVVAAAGNGGPCGLADPGYAPDVLAVGAATPNGAVASFSAGAAPSGGRRPDLVAPGAHVQGLRVPGSWIDRTHPDARLGTRWFRGSGTSEAAAIVSGAAALVLQRDPLLTPAQVKAFLVRGARRLRGEPARLQGAGELQLAGLLRAAPPAAVGARLATGSSPWLPSGWSPAAWSGSSWTGSTWGGR